MIFNINIMNSLLKNLENTLREVIRNPKAFRGRLNEFDPMDEFKEDKWIFKTLDGEMVPIKVNIRIYDMIGIPDKKEEMIGCLLNAVYQNYVRGDITQEHMIRLEEKLNDKTNRWKWIYNDCHILRQEEIN